MALTVDGELGHLFEAAQGMNTVAFVPDEVIPDTEDGYDQAAYFNSGWAAKNARFNSGETAKYAFPIIFHPVFSANERGVPIFLQRLRHAYSVELGKGIKEG